MLEGWFLSLCIRSIEHFSYLGTALILTVQRIGNQGPFSPQEVVLWHKFLVSVTELLLLRASISHLPLPLLEGSQVPSLRTATCASGVPGALLLPVSF